MKPITIIFSLVLLFSLTPTSLFAEDWEGGLMGSELVKKSASQPTHDSPPTKPRPEWPQGKKSAIVLTKNNDNSLPTLAGRPETRQKYKSVVALTLAGRMFCTGILREDGLILTAAHCINSLAANYDGDVEEFAKRIRVYVGNGNESGKISGQHKISRAVVHPYYLKRLHQFPTYFDIGFLVLENPNHSDFTATRIIPSTATDYSDFDQIEKYYSVAFGNSSIEYSTEQERVIYKGAGLKRFADINTTINLLHMTMNRHYTYVIFPGDSGGPIFGMTTDGREVLVGIHNSHDYYSYIYSFNAAYAKYWLNAYRKGTRLAVAKDLFHSAVNILFTGDDKQFDTAWKLLQEKNTVNQLEWMVRDLPWLMAAKISDHFTEVERRLNVERQEEGRAPLPYHPIDGFYAAAYPCKYPIYPPIESVPQAKNSTEWSSGDPTCTAFTNLYTPLLCDLLQDVLEDKSKKTTINGINEFIQTCHQSHFSLKIISEFM